MRGNLLPSSRAFIRSLDCNQDGGVKVATRVNPAAITLPPDHTYPMIMCGLGTGYAPFRAFMEERMKARDDGKRDFPTFLMEKHISTFRTHHNLHLLNHRQSPLQ